MPQLQGNWEYTSQQNANDNQCFAGMKVIKSWYYYDTICSEMAFFQRHPYAHTYGDTKPLAGKHDDVIKWKHFPRYWPFARGIQRSPVNSPHKGQWRRPLMFSLICVWLDGWVNNREVGDLRCYRDHYDVIVMECWLQTVDMIITLIARFMGPTWDPSGTDRAQMGPVLAPWTLLSGYFQFLRLLMISNTFSWIRRYNSIGPTRVVFHKELGRPISKFAKIRFTVIHILAIQSQRNSAHITKALLPWYVKRIGVAH